MGYSGQQRSGYGGRRGHGKGFKRRPIELGEELEVDITELSPKEEGITRVQGWVIHVPNAKPGEHIKIKITKMGNKTANAEIVKWKRDRSTRLERALLFSVLIIFEVFIFVRFFLFLEHHLDSPPSSSKFNSSSLSLKYLARPKDTY